METEMLKLAASQGFFAVLFTGLLFYVLKENAKREDRLLACLDALGRQYENLSRDIGEVRDDVKDLKGKVGV